LRAEAPEFEPIRYKFANDGRNVNNLNVNSIAKIEDKQSHT